MKSIFTVIILLLASNYTFSQTEGNVVKAEDSLVIVTLTSGDTRIGKILSDDGREVLLLTKDLGKIFISKQDISSIKPFDGASFIEENGEYSGTGPFTTRYYFTTNALPIKKGENYAMIHLYGPEVHFSLSNKFSLGIMSTWIGSPMVLAAKYSIPTNNEKINFGIGTLLGTSGYLNSFRGFGGLHWGMVTFGDRFMNLTISAGYAYIKTGFENNYQSAIGTYPALEDQWNPGQYYFAEIPTVPSKSSLGTAPVLSIAGVTKVGKKASLFFDSMFFFGKTSRQNVNVQDVYNDATGQPLETIVTEATGSENRRNIGFIMPGMRFQKTDKKAFQVALAGGFYENNGKVTAFPIPMCSWLVKF